MITQQYFNKYCNDIMPFSHYISYFILIYLLMILLMVLYACSVDNYPINDDTV